ncbi:hypothetical protein D3C84_1007230 [compost metagenome]
MIAAQIAVTELVTCLIDRRPSLFQGGAGSFQIGLRDIQLCLGTNPTVEQLLLAAGIGLGVDPLCLDLGQVALGGA